MLEGFQLFIKYDYIKGIFAMSCLFMVEVTILDYTMKVQHTAVYSYSIVSTQLVSTLWTE